ncbi:cytochrome b/b6 domain-containing protein [Sphingopyxis sp.]|uniref:cytochrome b/b6 domain-containing protein n=1 Tax=Sphingopyxis sp. TaxID=1908224 RepID=UPI002D768E43|nr:cytochrome b/b6 domain-containing protein [Sphingopyxis sp.]HET6522865.1 cytochrome b/b6 domain-containing protein [Sphingopyxis sp.]
MNEKFQHSAETLSLPETDGGDTGRAPSAGITIYRHPWPVRLFHWVNVCCFIILLMSGLQIFNAYPRLHVGQIGYYDTPAVFEIASNRDVANPRSWIAIDGREVLDTTGILGEVRDEGIFGIQTIAFPPWAILPQKAMDLHDGRGWHFLTLYFFAANLFAYLIYGIASGRFRRTLVPDRDQLRASSIARDLWMHLRLKHATGAEAERYNLLQKTSYILVLFLLLPSMVLTGMTMSPSFVAAFPWLIDMFAGRQTARLIHFISASLLVGFVVIHIFQLFVAGFLNEMRSILTGWFRVPEKRK